jgi:molecular chaperone DnaJ
MNVQDIFENLFGMGMKQKREGGNFGVSNEPGNDIQMDISLSFEDAFKDNKRDIRLSVEEKCGTCSGSGQKVGTSPTKCMHCNGSGMISRQTGFMIMQSSCPYCNGEGYSIDPCTSCDGSGLKFEQKNCGSDNPCWSGRWNASADTAPRVSIEGKWRARPSLPHVWRETFQEI